MNNFQDLTFLRESLSLARRGMGWTNPNPMVGVILVKDGQVIGKGYHKKAGLAHAEIEALASCKESPEGSTLYSNLEPCSHFGRTSPCIDEIIKAKIARVVCSTLDPNPKVHGNGAGKLRKAGIDVSVGTLGDEARLLNEAFFIFHEKNRPFIALKFAASLDGKIATKTGDSKWITNKRARQFARKLRAEYQAILVGISTIMCDNPHLGVRDKTKKDTLRIILDPKLRIPFESQVLRDDNVLLVTTFNASKKKIKFLQHKGTPILVFKNHEIPLKDLLVYLKDQEIISILIEGGGRTLGKFVDEELVDKVYAFYAPIIIGGEEGISVIGGSGAKYIKDAVRLKNVTFKKFDENMLIIGYPAMS